MIVIKSAILILLIFLMFCFAIGGILYVLERLFYKLLDTVRNIYKGVIK